MTDDERDDQRLTRLLSAVRAERDPALWTRVRAEIEAREARRAPAWLAWLMRPAAIGASLAVLAVAGVTAVALVVTTPRSWTTTADNLPDALVAEREAQATGSGAATPVTGVGIDSGSVR